MKVTAQDNVVTIDFENGYTMSGTAELTGNRKYFMYLDSLENFDPPHEDEMVSPEQLMEIVKAGQNPPSYLFPTVEFD